MSSSRKTEADWVDIMTLVMAQKAARRPGPVPTQPCGTLSAWRRHQRDPAVYGPICADCRRARAEYVAWLRRGKV